MFINYPTAMKIKEDVLLKDDILINSLLGNTVDMVAIFQQKGIKANRTFQPVLAVVIIILGSPARQKRNNATIAKRLDISRNFAE